MAEKHQGVTHLQISAQKEGKEAECSHINSNALYDVKVHSEAVCMSIRRWCDESSMMT